ncbi:MAG: thiamine diphosphokinase [Clostridiales bacterium]|nr:thiamine diphosphokinase [Clostridiales bacterium]
MPRCVIIGNANINNYNTIKKYLTKHDFFIFCDGGLKHQKALDILPNLIVGDFDSHPNPNLPIETIVLPHEKDDTDTVYAVKEAVSRGFSDFLLIGVIGERFDHSLGNISILIMLDSLGKTAKIVDDFSEIELVSKNPVFVNDSFPYFSLLNITGEAKGICIENAKYNLDNGTINCDYQYGISNEVLPGKIAKVTVNEGKLLLVKVF